jgi:hypothetical protein
LLVVAGAVLGARLEVRILLPKLFLRGGDQAKIMLGVLKVVFGRDRIARALRVARELKIFFRHMVGRAADLHVGAVGFVNPGQRVLIAAVVMLLVVIAPAAHALVMLMMLLTVSHGLLFNNS